jgi:hypothetical protein
MYADSGRGERLTCKVSCWICSAVILAHAGLLVRSHWEYDEYLAIGRQRLEGWRWVVGLYWGWSGRVISDALFGAYGAAVNAVHQPLAVWFGALLWLLLGACCLGPAWLGNRAMRWRRMAMAFALLALFLLGHGVNEVFYWSAAALAYLPTLAGACWLFWCVVDGLEERRIGAALALVLIAGSSEVGLLLAGAFAGLMILRVLAGGLRSPLVDVVCVLPGLCVALADAVVVMRSRGLTAELLGPAGATFHHPLASLVAAGPAFFVDAVAGEAGSALWPAAVGHVVSYLLVMLGARWCLGQERRMAAYTPYLPVLAWAFVIAGFASEVGAFYQFGEPCCERHETMRQCFLMLGFAAIGAWWGAVWPPEKGVGVAAAGPLMAAVVLMAVPRMPELLPEYRMIPLAMKARKVTWRSGMQAGPGEMVFVDAPDGRLISGAGLPIGTYQFDRDTGGGGWAVMKFFDKRVLRVVAPGNGASP